MKICSRCKEIKQLADFSKSGYADSLRTYCKTCAKGYYSNWLKLNKEAKNQKTKQYKEVNKTQVRAYNLAWQDSNREYTKQKRKDNRKLRAQYEREVLSKRPEYKMRQALRKRLKLALKSNKTSLKTLQILGCTMSFFKTYLESKFTEGMTWDNHGEWHLDHIKPLASFDLTKDSEILKAGHYSNIQPLWAIDNLKKGDR